jgi:hypothetical protein
LGIIHPSDECVASIATRMALGSKLLVTFLQASTMHALVYLQVRAGFWLEDWLGWTCC